MIRLQKLGLCIIVPIVTAFLAACGSPAPDPTVSAIQTLLAGSPVAIVTPIVSVTLATATPGPTYPASPRLIAPADGASADRKQDFAWEWHLPALGAGERFQWRLYDTASAAAAAPLAFYFTLDTRMQYRFAGIPPGSYWWGVRVVQVGPLGDVTRELAGESVRWLIRWLGEATPSSTPSATVMSTRTASPTAHSPVPTRTSTSVSLPTNTPTPPPVNTPVPPPTSTPGPTSTPVPPPTSTPAPPATHTSLPPTSAPAPPPTSTPLPPPISTPVPPPTSTPLPPPGQSAKLAAIGESEAASLSVAFFPGGPTPSLDNREGVIRLGHVQQADVHWRLKTPDAGQAGLPSGTPCPREMSEDFEGPFPPACWYTFDNNGSQYGEYFWARRDCRPHGGSYSGWGVGGGANGKNLGCGSDYPGVADSWMVYGPIDLSGAQHPELCFWYWLQSELTNDRLSWSASVDGAAFYGVGVSGDSQGWVPMKFDLTNVPTLGDLRGNASVWIAFGFASNDTQSGKGAYVDDIRLSANGCMTCPREMAQDFETAFPAGCWRAYDDDGSSNGEYLWARRNCRPDAGSYSAWAVGGGANGSALVCKGSYPDNANSWMIYGPFDLRDTPDPQLRYRAWWATEPNYDYLFRGASINGDEFFGTRFHGVSGDWQTGSLDFSNVPTLGDLRGQSAVWLAFIFRSDMGNAAEGVYIDDVFLNSQAATATSTPTVTRTPSRTPTRTPTSSPTRTPTSTMTMTPTRTPIHTPTPTRTTSSGRLYLPVFMKDYFCDPCEPNDSFGSVTCCLASDVELHAYFASEQDNEDIYCIQLQADHAIEIWLAEIPSGADYNLYLYDLNVVLIGYSGNIGNMAEHILTGTLPSGRYYVRVQRASGYSRLQPYLLRAVFE